MRDSSGVLATTDPEWFGAEIPIAGLAGEYRHRVVLYSVQPGRRGGDSLMLDTATARALAEHILAEML